MNIEVRLYRSGIPTAQELLPFLLERRAPGHEAFIIYDKLVVSGVKVSLEDVKAERKEEEGAGEVGLPIVHWSVVNPLRKLQY